MKSDEVSPAQESLQSRDLMRGTHAHQVDHVVVDDLHSHSFGQNRELVANVSIPDNTQRLASNLPTTIGNLVPYSLVQFIASVSQLACQSDDLGNDEFGDRS